MGLTTAESVSFSDGGGIAQADVAPAALARLSAVQLRQQCSARGLQWRNAHGRGRHLTKQETIARLTARCLRPDPAVLYLGNAFAYMYIALVRRKQ